MFWRKAPGARDLGGAEAPEYDLLSMSAPALLETGRPTLRIRGTPYPVLLPTLRDPRLHLAAVIVTLQVLGQVAFDFRLSIAQILVSLVTCAVLEVAIAFRRQRVILWPASALLSGNGIAFILRVPGTQHGDWWSMRGWWIYAATGAVAILSKHLIRLRGHHIFNPSNFGLVLCFLILGEGRADPLEFWWGPMSPWLALALAVIVAGGFAILSRLRLVGIAVSFWLAFAGGIGVLAASGHAMTASWHLGEITGTYLWRVLVFSPEILIFLFFMITDPKTVPEGRVGRRAFGLSVALLAVLLIAPQTTEYWTKVAVLGALTIVCAVRPLVEMLLSLDRAASVAAGLARHRTAAPAAALAAAAGFAGLLVLAGIPARTSAGAAATPLVDAGALPQVTVAASKGVASQIDRPTSLRIAQDVVADLRNEALALQRRDPGRAAVGAEGPRLAGLQQHIGAARGRAIVVPEYRVDRLRLRLEPGSDQGPPTVLATLDGALSLTTYAGSPATVVHRGDPKRFTGHLRLSLRGTRYVIVGPRLLAAGSEGSRTGAAVARAVADAFGGVRLQDVAAQVGLDFRQGAFREKVTGDPTSMMGGGLCWLDYDSDGWMDLFVVNSYSELDVGAWEQRGGLPRSALFHNVHGRFVDVTASSHAGLPVRGDGCVAADFNGDGHTDLFVTTTGTSALLWNRGDGTFSEGARRAGVDTYGWHTSAAVADVNGDGRPDLFVAGYTDLNAPIPGASGGFPTDHQGVRDLLYLNEGLDAEGHSRFREVGARAGIERARVDHGLGATFTDVNGDGRPDLYVANDEDPNRLYVNVPWRGGAKADPAGLGFRLEERAGPNGVADRNAGMGVAAADVSGDGRPDLFVTNSRGQLPAAFRSRGAHAAGALYADARPAFTSALDGSFAGWGVAWADLNRDGNLDLVLANGRIPVTNLARDAEPVQVMANLSGHGLPGRFGDASAAVGLSASMRLDGRGLAAADFDNDGNVDVAINTIGGRLVLLRTTSPSGHWLEVSLQGFHPGALVTATLPGGRSLVREVQAGSSYLSSGDPRVHFGLGDATTVRTLLVRFPGGRSTRLVDVPADRVVAVAEP